MRANKVTISVKEVIKSYGKVKVVDNISFEIGGGEFVALLGHNGAGKTTTIEMLEGLCKPDAGEIKLFNRTWDNEKDYIIRHIGVSLQETHFQEKVTVKEIVELFAGFYRLGNNRVSEVLELTRLNEKRHNYIESLSGGLKQRLVLALGILHYPRILLLDEPTMGLDPVSRREIWQILEDMRSFLDMSLLLTTHYMDEASELCERIMIMKQGKIVLDGKLNVLLNDYLNMDIIEFDVAEPIYDLKLDDLLINQEWKSGKMRLLVNNINIALPKLYRYMEERGQTVTGLECKQPILEDLYFAIHANGILPMGLNR